MERLHSNSKIFLVDDDSFCLNLVEAYLLSLGFKNITAFNATTTFLDQLTESPDIVFLDYSMDNLNGIDILKKVKRFQPDLPVIFISGQEKINVAVDALKYGAFDYILKEELCQEKIQHTLDKLFKLKTLLKEKNKNLLARIMEGFGFSIN